MSKILVEEVQNVTYTVDGKAYKTKEAADAALASLENVQEGLEFTEALYAGLATRAKRTKANLIGEYLDWVADGKPVVVEEEPASA